MTGPRNILRVGAMVGALTISVPVQAATEYGLAIAATGTQHTTLGYIRFMSGATISTATCPYGVVYIDLTNEAGRVKMAIAITAKASGRPISRLDYVNDGSRCWVYLLEI